MEKKIKEKNSFAKFNLSMAKFLVRFLISFFVDF
jgi:hypothetical protein